MYYNFAKYGHKSRLDGLRHRQIELERIGIQPIIDDTNQAGEAIKLIHEWLNKQIAQKPKLFNIKSQAFGPNDENCDEVMSKKGVIACLYHMLQQVTDKIKSHETAALETKSQLHKFKALINAPTNALDQYDLFIPPRQDTKGDIAPLPGLGPLPTNTTDKDDSKTTPKDREKNESGNNLTKRDYTPSGIQMHESDLLVQQNEQLVETFADVSQDIDIVTSVQNRLYEISTMFVQFSTTLNDQLDIFENIRDNLQLSIGNIETTGENLKQSLEREFSLVVMVAYLFLVAGVVLFLLDFSRWR